VLISVSVSVLSLSVSEMAYIMSRTAIKSAHSLTHSVLIFV